MDSYGRKLNQSSVKLHEINVTTKTERSAEQPNITVIINPVTASLNTWAYSTYG